MTPARPKPLMFDDDPSPRFLRPSGSLDKLPDGAHRLPDLRNVLDMGRPSPVGLNTARQKRQFALDLAMFLMHRNGATMAEVGEHYGKPRESVRNAINRCKRLVKAQRAG